MWLDLAKFNLDKYDDNSSRDYVVNLEHSKKLNVLPNDYHFAPDKLEIEREMFSDYQLKIADDYNISIANVKN